MPNSNAGAIQQVFMITRDTPVQAPQGPIAPLAEAVVQVLLGASAFLVVQFSSETRLVFRGDGTTNERGRLLIGCFVDGTSCHPGPVGFAEPSIQAGDPQSPSSSFTWVSDRLESGRHSVQMFAGTTLGTVSLGRRTLIVQVAV